MANIQNHIKRAKPFRSRHFKRVFCCRTQHTAKLPNVQIFVAGELKKISGGTWSKDGVKTGQRASSCITESKPYLMRGQKEQATPLNKGSTIPKSGTKRTRRKGGQGVCPAAGEKGCRSAARGFP